MGNVRVNAKDTAKEATAPNITETAMQAMATGHVTKKETDPINTKVNPDKTFTIINISQIFHPTLVQDKEKPSTAKSPIHQKT